MNSIKYMILVGTALAAFHVGELNYRSKVVQNCLASGISKIICSNYIKIIDRKEWLLLKVKP